MSKSIYHGAATVISAGIEIPVEAALYTHPPDPQYLWGGTIRPVEPGKYLWAELEGDVATIRLPDGRQGRVLVRGSGFGPVEISGEGPQPA